jgi:hypothetical protein
MVALERTETAADLLELRVPRMNPVTDLGVVDCEICDGLEGG